MLKCLLGGVVEFAEFEASHGFTTYAVISFILFDSDGSLYMGQASNIAVPVSSNTTLASFKTATQTEIRTQFAPNTISFVWLDDKGLL